VFLALAVHLTDEAKLDRMVPYIVDLLHDEAAVVRGRCQDVDAGG